MMFFGGDRRGFVRISGGGICCEGVVNGKVEIIYFFTRVFVIR